ncbi:hypothetical protein [Bacteroides acidifaciens]|uniref:hypothetical protein n=1 Tax=Bacteroides acidifaciens TaxID=85831 RepID=UPI0025979B86|nr:hypothetical protein [Bacteroides acidifaciens]
MQRSALALWRRGRWSCIAVPADSPQAFIKTTLAVTGVRMAKVKGRAKMTATVTGVLSACRFRSAAEKEQ